ncbi:DUF2304 domain-containing protein [Paenibacillus agricola]|uniref:DUF2304 domain-containing protein n=1 Tax=Paenibacillus agricola TaxID=2716264 RepID=A0ABX0JDS2_9BACL|nr:DUF2304 domain-containing protein [Paenibacillus agricola]NHN34277.1 DUF2304 domain-containing protein [Paenibacillus agricola]
MEYKLILISRIIAILVSIYILNKTRKNLLIEKESFYWVIGCLVVVLLTIFPDSLVYISELLGIKYPPATLFLIAIILILILLYRQLGRISLLTTKVNELIRTVAILTFELESYKKEHKMDK